jgi:hypothetical protein
VKKSVVARRSKACISVVFTEILCGYFVVIAPLKLSRFSRGGYVPLVRGGTVGWGTALQAGRLRVRFPIVLLEYCIDILPVAPWPSCWLGLWQKWVPGILSFPPSCADCLEIW